MCQALQDWGRGDGGTRPSLLRTRRASTKTSKAEAPPQRVYIHIGKSADIWVFPPSIMHQQSYKHRVLGTQRRRKGRILTENPAESFGGGAIKSSRARFQTLNMLEVSEAQGVRRGRADGSPGK